MLRSIGPRSVSADNHILWLDRYSLTWPISRTDRNLMTSARECEDAREHSAAVMSSPVWNFYDVARNNEKFAICRVCSKEISRGGVLSKTFNTTNLIRHLRTSHRETYAEYEKLATAKKATVTTSNTTLTQPSITDILKKHELYTPDSKKDCFILFVCFFLCRNTILKAY